MLIRESLYNFKRGEDIISSSGIGNIALIKRWLYEYGVTNYIVDSNYEIDVNGSVDLVNKNLTELPEYIQFNIVRGYFDISKNNLTSLRGCPKKVDGYFDCHTNKNLESLEFCPKIVGSTFSAASCNLKSLQYCPKIIKGIFAIQNNKNLTTLKFGPRRVGSNYCAWDCGLTEIGTKTEFVGEIFNVNNNKLTSLENSPATTSCFYCKNNENKFTTDDVLAVSNVLEFKNNVFAIQV